MDYSENIFEMLKINPNEDFTVACRVYDNPIMYQIGYVNKQGCLCVGGIFRINESLEVETYVGNVLEPINNTDWKYNADFQIDKILSGRLEILRKKTEKE